MREISLSQGKFAIVDESDFDALNAHKWYAHSRRGRFYAGRMSPTPNRKHIYMHRQIMSPPAGMEIDHIDGDGLNNQRVNLRVCTRSQNARNKDKQKSNKSGFKGVYFDKHARKFVAQIWLNGKRFHLGYHLDALDSAKAYDTAAIRLHGEYAQTNFNDNQEELCQKN